MKTPILLLHGWSKEMTGTKYQEVASLLEKKGYKVYIPDLPGFGNNPLTKQAMTFDDYVAFVKDFIQHTIQAESVILMGHSFGGRIAIRFTADHPKMVEKLILADASGIPQKLTLKKKVAQAVAKLGKPIITLPPFSFFYPIFRKILYRSIGEMDYYKSGNLAQTFKNVYIVSIVADLPKIPVPTLIVWGEKDTFTPLSDGSYMARQIKDAKFAIIQDVGHKLPYENPKAFTKEVLSFL